MSEKPPQRACVLIAKIEADSPQDMSAHLEQLARDIDRKELGQTSVSGGYSSGHILTYSECGEPSHEQWFKDLQAHLEEKRTARDDRPEAKADPPSASVDELLMTSLNTGRIVCSGDLTELQIAAARSERRFYVNPRGFGFAMLPWDLSTLKDLEREGARVSGGAERG